MNCPKCGTIVPAGARFCPGCGAPQTPAAANEADNGYARLYPDEPGSVAPVSPPASVTPPSPPPVAPQPGYAAPPPAAPQPAPGYQSPPYQQAPYQQQPYQPAPPVQDYPVEQNSSPRWPWLLGGAALIALSLAAFGYMRDGSTLKPVDDQTLAEQSSEGKAEAAAPKVISPAETLYVAAEANVRDKPTTSGTKVVGKLARGTSVTGDVVMGAKDQRWLKLTGKEEYVSMVNLTKTAMPVLATTSSTDATIASRCAVLSEPDPNAPVKVTLQPGNKIKITGLTDSGYAEFALPRGGVGYVEREGQPCLIPAGGATGSSGDFAPPATDGPDEPPLPDDGFIEEK